MKDSPVKLVLNDEASHVVARSLKLEGFFPEISAEHLAKVFPRSGLYAFPRGFLLMEQDLMGRDLFVIYKGSVTVRRVYGSAAATVATLGAGDILGEMALLRDGVRTATAELLDDSVIYRLAYEDVVYLLAHNEELAIHLRNVAALRQTS